MGDSHGSISISAANRYATQGDVRTFSAHRPRALFGSVASGSQRAGSDLDIAGAAKQALTADEQLTLIGALAERTGRPIDLNVASEPLPGQIVRHGKRILGSDTLYGELISRHVFEQTDFMPYRARLLEERQIAWIGK